MSNLGLEEDPRLVRIFNEFDRKRDEAMEFVEWLRGVVSMCDDKSAPIERARCTFMLRSLWDSFCSLNPFPLHVCAPCYTTFAVLFQTYDMNNNAALTHDEMLEVLTTHTDFKALKGEDDAKAAEMSGASKSRSKDEIKTFFYTWLVACLAHCEAHECAVLVIARSHDTCRRLKRVSSSVKTRSPGSYRFEEWWRLLHADCKGRAMYTWIKVHLPSLIAVLRKADQAEEALELEDNDAEDVFYATGVPRELM